MLTAGKVVEGLNEKCHGFLFLMGLLVHKYISQIRKLVNFMTEYILSLRYN